MSKLTPPTHGRGGIETLSPGLDTPIDTSPATPDVARLPRAGALLAAAWFTLCGADVSWPLEPSRYDLIVGTSAGLRRVQVKTTTTRAGDTWKVYLSTARRQRRIYSADEIDDFFIVDGDLGCYVIPLAAVGGLQAIHLRGYEKYRVGSPFAVPIR